MAEEQRDRNVLNYSTPEAEQRPVPPRRPVDGYCVAGLLVALLSPIHAVVAGGAVALGAYGALRASEPRRRVRGRNHGLVAIVVALFWPVLAHQVGQSLPSVAPGKMTLLKCEANMRQIGQIVALYESSYPGATGYGVEDLDKSKVWTSHIRCPLDCQGGASGTPHGGSAYVLLPSLQPYQTLQNPANTVIAFDLHTHVWATSDREYTRVVLLYADGHVGDETPIEAQKAITRSLMARPTTQPASTQPVQ